jgi:glutathione S-transferase
LAEKYGNGSLLPIADVEQRAKFFQICFYTMTELDAHTLYIISKHGGSLMQYYKRSPEAVDVAISGFNQQILVAEGWLNSGSYILSQTFTVADILLCTCLMSAVRLAVKFPLEIPDKLIVYMESLQNREVFQQAETVNQGVAKL